MKSPLHNELDRLAESVAEQISRYRDRGDIFLDAATHRVRRAFDFFEDLFQHLAAKSESKSPLGSYGHAGREDHRTHNLRTWPGCGFGCDICGGGFDTKSFMSLSIGSHKAKLLVDLCLPCSKRLSSVVDARLEDRRYHANR